MTRTAASLTACLVLCTAQIAAEPVPLTAWTDEPQFSMPKLSPDGTKLGAIVGRDKKQFLAEITLASFEPHFLAELEDDARLTNYWWKGSDLLLLLVQNTNGSRGFRTLDLRTKKVDFLLDYGWNATLVNPLPADPENILVSLAGIGLHKINVRTGKKIRVEKAPPDVGWWASDQEGRAIAGIGRKDEKDFLLWRPGPEAGWQRRELGPSIRPNLEIACIHPDQRRLIAWDYSSAGTATVVALDPDSMAKELFFSDETVDPDYVSVWDDDNAHPRAVVYETDKPHFNFFNADDAKVQAVIDSALPGTANFVISATVDEQLMVIQTVSDRDRGGYYLLDRRNKRIRPLGVKFNGYDPAGPCVGRSFQFASRDGLAIHGRITLPHDQSRKPAVVVVVSSGSIAGPRSRNYFQVFDQILASRGFAVARIDYRGTVGYGQAFLKAGDYQVDKGMPNDLADGVRWIEQQGWVDEKRVAVCGSGLGGIVVIHALAQNPTLFAAWINRGTPLNVDNLEVREFATAPRLSREAESDLGGWRSARNYAGHVDPSPLVAQIKVPSYHTYVIGLGPPNANATRMETLLKASRGQHFFRKGVFPLEKGQQNKFWTDYLTDMLAFLEKTLREPPQ